MATAPAPAAIILASRRKLSPRRIVSCALGLGLGGALGAAPGGAFMIGGVVGLSTGGGGSDVGLLVGCVVLVAGGALGAAAGLAFCEKRGGRSIAGWRPWFGYATGLAVSIPLGYIVMYRLQLTRAEGLGWPSLVSALLGGALGGYALGLPREPAHREPARRNRLAVEEKLTSPQ